MSNPREDEVALAAFFTVVLWLTAFSVAYTNYWSDDGYFWTCISGNMPNNAVMWIKDDLSLDFRDGIIRRETYEQYVVDPYR